MARTNARPGGNPAARNKPETRGGPPREMESRPTAIMCLADIVVKGEGTSVTRGPSRTRPAATAGCTQKGQLVANVIEYLKEVLSLDGEWAAVPLAVLALELIMLAAIIGPAAVPAVVGHFVLALLLRAVAEAAAAPSPALAPHYAEFVRKGRRKLSKTLKAALVFPAEILTLDREWKAALLAVFVMDLVMLGAIIGFAAIPVVAGSFILAAPLRASGSATTPPSLLPHYAEIGTEEIPHPDHNARAA